MIRTGFLMLLAGCGTPVAAGDMDVTGFSKVESTECDSGDTSCQSLAATVSGTSVHVVDSAVTLTCCMDTTPVVSVDGAIVSVEYTESGDPCDCVCNHDLAYDIGPFESGTWTIHTPTGEQDVTVP
jgi:hypothetical protein